MAKAEPSAPSRPLLMLGALGVVFGDLGTSPLYVLKAVLAATGGHLSADMALGSLSLIVWTLIITLSIKYCLLVMRAGNHGEGGILALMSLIRANRIRGRRWALAVIGLFGAALIYGDGMITPAISVLGALEGLDVVTHALHAVILPAALAILLGLFLVQRYGTAKIGLAFGPIMLIWFAVIALLGALSVVRHPHVLVALDPLYAARFFRASAWHAFLALGGIFLCVTGGEALYADMGHFGRTPIRLSWYFIVFPALVLNYAGQIGNLLAQQNVTNPFFQLAPGWAIYPLVGLATLATIIASQAIISGAFTLSRQAVHLGWLPGLTIRQTSHQRYGQVYVPAVNSLMMVATLAVTLIFRSSTRLAGAYGIAVSTTMLLTTILLISAMGRLWNWPRWAIAAIGGLFLVTDSIYLAANLVKLGQGGWIPLGVAIVIFVLMLCWRAGLDSVHRRVSGGSCQKCLKLLRNNHVPRVPGVAVFLTRTEQAVPSLLTQHIRHMGALQETVIVLSVGFAERPRVAPQDRASARYLGAGLWRAKARFGFIERPNLLEALEGIEELKHINFRKVIYFGARDLVSHDTDHPRLARWQLPIFAFLFRNAVKTMDRFHIPPENFVEIARDVRI